MRPAPIGVLALLTGIAGPVAAQRPPASRDALAIVGESARSAWTERDFARLFAGGTHVQLRLPGADPSAGVGEAQAVSLLRDYVRGTTDLTVELVSDREVGTGRAFVDLRRRYRLDGTQEERVESVFLGYRRVGTGWRLVDLRVLPGP